jgi:hypothetical protein
MVTGPLGSQPVPLGRTSPLLDPPPARSQNPSNVRQKVDRSSEFRILFIMKLLYHVAQYIVPTYKILVPICIYNIA